MEQFTGYSEYKRQQTGVPTTNTAAKRRMLKSPSAKELGRHRMQPIEAKKEEAKRPIGFTPSSKIPINQRSSIKGNRPTANATVRPNTNQSTNKTLGLQRAKFTPSVKGVKPTTALDKKPVAERRQ